MTTLLMDAAVKLAKLGIAVFPLRPKAKVPYGKTTGLYGATDDPLAAQERWAGRWALPLKPIEELRKKNPGKSEEWLLRPVIVLVLGQVVDVRSRCQGLGQVGVRSLGTEFGRQGV